MVPVPHHEDDVGPDPLDDMLPADAVVIQDGVVEILDAGAGVRGGVPQGCLKPDAGEFPGYDRGIEADDADLMTTYGELYSFENPLCWERFVSVTVAIAIAVAIAVLDIRYLTIHVDAGAMA